MKEKTRVLFICIHNSGRSQMAETFLKAMDEKRFEAESAGLDPKPINPHVIKVMEEIGYDLSGNTSDSIMRFFKEGRLYDYIITVCDESIENDIIIVRFFPVLPEDYTGLSLIPKKQREQRMKSWKKSVPSGIRSKRTLNPGSKVSSYILI